MNEEPIQELEYDETPDVQKLANLVKDVLREGTTYHDRMKSALDTQYCVWEGQSDDGRKWEENLDKTPFPWDGCHDLRVRLAQEVTEEAVDRLTNGFHRAELQGAVHGSGDPETVGRAVSLMRWLMTTQMQPELDLELDLATDWRQSLGFAVAHVGWEQEVRLVPQEMTVQDLLGAQMERQMAALAEQDPQAAADPAAQQWLQDQAQQSVEQFLASLADPLQLEGLAISMQQERLPHMTVAQVQAVLEEVRDTGRAMYPIQRMEINRPCVTALVPLVDVFFPLSTGDLRRSPWVTWVTYYLEDELRNQVLTEQWDESWVKKAIELKGKDWDPTVQEMRDRLTLPEWDGTASAGRRGWDTTKREEVIPVFHTFHRAMDKKGFIHIRETIHHPDISDGPALSRPMPYDHGWMPFVAFRRERKSRALLQSRGIPEVVMTHQTEIKTYRDRRADRADLATLPPATVPGDRGGGRYPFRPGAQLPTRRGAVPTMMDLPPMDSGAIEMENRIREDMDRLFGRWSATVPEPVSIDKQQAEMTRYLGEIREIGRHIWALAQQYLEPVTVSRVTGDDEQRALTVSREDIQGQWDFSWHVDVRDLNMEYVTSRVKLVAEILGIDNAGRVDRGELVRYAIRGIDPTLAGRVLVPAQAANERERESERNALVQMMAGLEPDLIEGQDHRTRLQVLLEAAQQNPSVAQRMQTDELFAALLENRVKHHEFMLQQEENARIGRVGAKKVLEG